MADFKNHPFKVEMNTELFELMQTTQSNILGMRYVRRMYLLTCRWLSPTCFASSLLMNTELFELMQSIEKEGVLVPLLARPNPAGQGYELIAGHRRKAASKWAGVDKVLLLLIQIG